MNLLDPTGELSPREIITQIARERLEAFVGLIRADGTYISRVYESLRSLSEEISHDYGGRFLVELIQNGYDAHPPETKDGVITIHVRTSEGEFGTLYVANGGNGFTRSNVEALCDVALSDKPVGETIGNKGLGFRSVLSISSEPEIYSKLGRTAHSNFDGFCFRFATSEDFKAMISEPHHCELANRDLPPFHIPVTIDTPSTKSFVQNLAQSGFSTVVRLPLLSEFALNVVLEAIEDLRQPKAPLLAFLKRLTKLTVEVEDKPSLSFSLSRSSTPVPSSGKATTDSFELVDMAASGRFLICWRKIQEQFVKDAIGESIKRGQLHRSWARWSGDGELAIAVPIESDRSQPRFYTYLPMGSEAEAPLPGLLHAAFYPKADRTSLDASVPLNDLYIREAVRLAASAIYQLRFGAIRVPTLASLSIGHVIVDLISWTSARGIAGGDRDFPALMAEALREIGVPLESSALLPIVSIDGTDKWSSSSNASRWDAYADGSVINLFNLVKFSRIAALPPELGKERISRLECFLVGACIRETLEPSSEEQARAIEEVALHLHQNRRLTDKVDTWKGFYKDLGNLFEKVGAEHWAQRSILLCSDGRLRSSSPQKRTRQGKTSTNTRIRTAKLVAIFVPPARRRSGVLTTPSPLRPYFAFLDARLGWTDELEHIRQALESANLVRKYDAGEIIASLSAIATTQRSVSIRRAVLEWVFKLWIETEGGEVLRRADLQVPGLDRRWVRARVAIFSRGWPETTLGGIVHSLIDKAGPNAVDLSKLRRRLLAGPRTVPFSKSKIKLWSEFLEALGVQKGLRIEQLQPISPSLPGFSISLTTICQQLKIGPNSQRYIAQQVGKEPEITYTGTSHRLPTNVSYIPGQEDFSSLDDEGKGLFSYLVLECLPGLTSPKLMMEEHSEHFPSAGRTKWPSPALAFLQQEQWFPVDPPENQYTISFVRPKNVLLEPESGERLPVFLPRPARLIRKPLAQEPICEALQRICGTGVFDQHGSLIAQTQLLANAFASAWFPSAQVRAFENLYWDTWCRLIKISPTVKWYWIDEHKMLVFRRQGFPVAISLAASQMGNSNLYVRDTKEDLAPRLLEDLGHYVWDAGAEVAKQAGEYVTKELSSDIRRTSMVGVQILIDQQSAENVKGHRALEIMPSLPQVISRCMAALKGFAAQQLPRNWMPVFELVGRLNIKVGRAIEVSIEGHTLPLPSDFHGCLALGNPQSPTVLIQAPERLLGWESIKNARRSIAQAIGFVEIAPHLGIAFSSLQEAGLTPDAPLKSIPWEVVERDLQLSEADIRKAVAAIGGNQEWLLRFLKPLIVYYTGEKGLELLGARGDDELSTDLIRRSAKIMAVQRIDEVRLSSLLETVRSYEDLLDELELDLGQFNQALKSIGEKPLSYRELQVNALHGFLSEQNDRIMEHLRLAYLTAFESFGDLSGYVSARNAIDELEPDPNWLETIREPTTVQLESFVMDFINSLHLPRRKTKTNLPSLSTVRDYNTRQIRSVTRRVAPIIRAWCYKNHVPGGVWVSENVEDQNLSELSRIGASDFIQLNEENVIRWFQVIAYWPGSMRATTSTKLLGLSEEDLDIERQKATEKEQQLKRERRSVLVNDRLLDPDDLDVPSLASEFEQLISVTVGLPDLHSNSAVHSPGVRTPRRLGGGGVGSRKHLTSQQSDLVGFLGELAVYQWLKKSLPGQKIDKAWVSKNRENLLAGSGNDNLGYDFEVLFQRRKVFLEVKAHLGDPRTFELGETQVIRAQECARQRRDFKIAYVSSLANTGNLRIEILPNPFTREGQSIYRLDGQGLRYRFAR